MDLGENYSSSFEFVKKMLSDGGRLIILIVLAIIPIVNWIVTGYAARVLRESPSSKEPPKLEKYGELFVDGAKIFFATLIYMIVPILLLIFGGVAFLFAAFGGVIRPEMLQGQRPFLGPETIVMGGTALTLLLAAIIVGVIVLIFLAAALAHMIKKGQFSKAFAFSEILGRIRKIGWGRYLAWLIVTVLIVAVVQIIASSIPLVGFIISAIIAPLISVFVGRSLGTLYGEGT